MATKCQTNDVKKSNHRAQVFGAVVTLAMQFILPILCSVIFFVLFCSRYWPIPFAYLVFIVAHDWNRPSTGGRRFSWVRNMSLWKHVRDYFPITLVKTSKLDAKKNYIFAFHPHGIIVVSAFINFATEANGFSRVFPGITPYLLVLKLLFRFPLFRDLYLAFGMCDVSKDSIKYLCNDKKGGNAVIIVVGGAAESLDAHPGSCTIHLKDRKGFVRMALLTGTDLVPVYSFGETNIYDQPRNHVGTLLRRIQDRIREWMTFAPVLPYALGPLPYRRRICTVVGEPIKVVKQSRPTPGDINLLHEVYIRRLKQLFDTYKREYSDYPDAELEIL